MRVHNPRKRVRTGIKVFSVGCAQTHYLYEYVTYLKDRTRGGLTTPGALLAHADAVLPAGALIYACAYPDHRVLLIAVEICSAAYYFDDTMETLVANAICADGAAACLLTCRPGRREQGPAIAGFASALDPSLQDLVGFEQRQGRLRIILAPTIRDVAPAIAEQALGQLLTAQGLERTDIRFWLLHPGGRKVIDRVQESLGLTNDEVALSRRVLRNYGNMSSPTVLFVLHELMQANAARPGDRGVLLALGPGLAAEAALLRW